jgi:hypothetical protein
MIGGMSGKLAGAIGEGMSDTVAIYMNGDDAVAEYSYNRTQGIRRYRYTNYPNTYSDVLGQSVHGDGEIYAATMWKLRQLWLDSGRTHDQLWNYVIDGMNYTPAGPAYEDMRDGILASMTDPADECLVWDAFASFGIGVGADGRVSPSFGVTESFAKPAECSGGANTAPTVTITAPASGSSFQEGTSVTFTGTASDAQDTNLDASALVWKANGTQFGTGATVVSNALAPGAYTIEASATDSGALKGVATISITITSLSPPTGITLTTRGYKVKGVRRVDLTWSGATSAEMDVYLDSSPVVTTGNDGAYTHVLSGKGSGSFTFKVCEAGTTTCSNTSTVVF